MKARIFAWFIWFIVALQVVLVALSQLLEALALSASSPLGVGFVADALIGAAVTLVFPAVGALIFWHRPEHSIGWLFCAANLGWAINNFGGSYARYALVENPGSLPAGELVAWFYTWPGIISVGLFVLLVLLFPDGTLLSRRWRAAAWLVIGWVTLSTVVVALAPGPIDDSIGLNVNNPLGIGGTLGHILEQLKVLAMPLGLPLFAIAALSMLLRLRQAKGVERQQLKWFTSAIAFLTIGFAVQVGIFVHYGSVTTMPIWAQFINGLIILSTGLIPVAAGIAILRYRLYDIDIIINRALVYGLLSTSLALLYFGSVVLLQGLLRTLTAQESQAAIVISTLAIAALFNPLRKRIQAFIDKRFYRRKYDAQKTLAAFNATLRNEVELEKLTGELLKVIDETMQPKHVSLWLREPEVER